MFAEFLSGNHDGDGRFCDEVVGEGTKKDALRGASVSNKLNY